MAARRLSVGIGVGAGDRSFFAMNAFATLGFHPQLLAYAAVLMMYTLVLVEARRMWCAVRLNRDVGKWWVDSRELGA